MRRNKTTGFTLIELMITVAILAIIIAIAVPVYYSQVEKTRRSDAITSLMETSQQLERCFTRTNSYENCLDPESFDSVRGFYGIRANTNPTTYTLTATAQGSQSGDSCSPFELDHLGNRDAGSSTDRCWGSN